MNITGKLEFDLDFIIKGLSLSGTISYNDTYSKGTMYNKEVPTYKVTRNPENQSEILFFGGTTSPIQYPITYITTNGIVCILNQSYFIPIHLISMQ